MTNPIKETHISMTWKIVEFGELDDMCVSNTVGVIIIVLGGIIMFR